MSSSIVKDLREQRDRIRELDEKMDREAKLYMEKPRRYDPEFTYERGEEYEAHAGEQKDMSTELIDNTRSKEPSKIDRMIDTIDGEIAILENDKQTSVKQDPSNPTDWTIYVEGKYTGNIADLPRAQLLEELKQQKSGLKLEEISGFIPNQIEYDLDAKTKPLSFREFGELIEAVVDMYEEKKLELYYKEEALEKTIDEIRNGFGPKAWRLELAQGVSAVKAVENDFRQVAEKTREMDQGQIEAPALGQVDSVGAECLINADEASAEKEKEYQQRKDLGLGLELGM
jgi:hypothetical protein